MRLFIAIDLDQAARAAIAVEQARLKKAIGDRSSLKWVRDEQMHPVELRERVTSPGGTTIRAVRELEQAGVRAAFLNAITAATERSRELSERVSS